MPRDFEGFRAWPSFELEGDGGDGHAAGTRTVYVSALVTDDGFGFATLNP